MFELLKNLFGGGDDERRTETRAADATRKLEMDEPMAGAGAQLSGQRDAGETESVLKRGD